MDRCGVFLARFRFILTHRNSYITILPMMQEENNRKPILIVTDSISGSSGLARIGRDLSVRIHEHLSDVYRLGTAGWGGVGSSKFPWMQYHFEGVQSDWVLPSLPEIVQDFSGDERCILLMIGDLNRYGWFSQPDRLGGETLARYPGLKQWLKTANIAKWLYVPIDSSGPNNKLSFPIALTALGFDRLLAYGSFGESVLRASIGDEDADKRHLRHLPHGIESSTFYEIDRKLSRKLFLEYIRASSILVMVGAQKETPPIQDDECLIHLIATNQGRKDWVLGLETCAILARTRKIRVWAHTDALERTYSIPSLLVDFGLLDKTVISLGYVSDDKMAVGYSASDLGLGIGLGEGMGYTIHESLFCGCPCLHGNYGGAPEWMGNSDLLIEPVAYRYEGSYAAKRPVFSAQDWANKADYLIGKRCNHNGDIDWERLWKSGWEPYLMEAAK